ncbi:hypothetical protein AK830_g7149 [Neonectria ditissima]|uniref:Uncharacterized protein n=1 Tax=Neonectria ditissima TaxID=78410 RepID=A0A0N8H6M8_9HYPO|nr:hypothetical protein AK830_g7149 [Neonectria ditissima]
MNQSRGGRSQAIGDADPVHYRRWSAGSTISTSDSVCSCFQTLGLVEEVNHTPPAVESEPLWSRLGQWQCLTQDCVGDCLKTSELIARTIRNLEASNTPPELIRESIEDEVRWLKRDCREGLGLSVKLIEVAKEVQTLIKAQRTAFSRTAILWTVSSFVSAMLVHTEPVAGHARRFTIIGLLAVIARPAWFALQGYRADRMLTRLYDLKHSFAQGTICEKDQRDMEASHFGFLRLALDLILTSTYFCRLLPECRAFFFPPAHRVTTNKASTEIPPTPIISSLTSSRLHAQPGPSSPPAENEPLAWQSNMNAMYSSPGQGLDRTNLVSFRRLSTDSTTNDANLASFRRLSTDSTTDMSDVASNVSDSVFSDSTVESIPGKFSYNLPPGIAFKSSFDRESIESSVRKIPGDFRAHRRYTSRSGGAWSIRRWVLQIQTTREPPSDSIDTVEFMRQFLARDMISLGRLCEYAFTNLVDIIKDLTQFKFTVQSQITSIPRSFAIWTLSNAVIAMGSSDRSFDSVASTWTALGIFGVAARSS